MSTQLTRQPRQQPDAATASTDGSWYAASLPRLAPWGFLGAALLAGAVAHLSSGLPVGVAVVIGWLVYVVGLTLSSRLVEGARKSTDRLATTLVTSAFVIALLPLTTLLWQVVSLGAPAVDSTFLTNSMRNVVGPGGGIYHALAGTLIVTGLATLISVPVGVLTAVYLVEYGRGRLAGSITFLVDVMTGIPSIVAGLFAYALFVIFFGEGVRMGFAGSVALSLLMIPLVVRSSEEMLKLVPHELREASYALGVPKWRTIVKVVVPTALAGIITGITIAIARIIGETAPLLIICGATDSTNFDPFHGRIMTLPVFIFNQYAHPGIPPQFSVERAWGAALVLTVIVMVLNLCARLVSHYFSPKTKA
jgi:phosphate transport system permease protein